MQRTSSEQLVHFLTDMYSVEQQALAQLVSASAIAGDKTLAIAFQDHYVETKTQAALVRERVVALGGSPSAAKDAVMKLGGKSFLLFARVQPETPGRLVAHAYAYEAMEWAGYQMLANLAVSAGDSETADVAKRIGMQEQSMMERLERGFDAAAQASHSKAPHDELQDQVNKHLAEAHALERQSVALLKKSEAIGGGEELTVLYHRLLNEAEAQAISLEEQLEARNAAPSLLKDAALAFGGFNWALFFQAQSDTPAKLAAFVFAVLHLQLAGYELFKRTAERAAADAVVRFANSGCAAKRTAALRLQDKFREATDATLVALQA